MNGTIHSSKNTEENTEKNTEVNHDKTIHQKTHLTGALWLLIVGIGLLTSLLMQGLLCPLRSEPVYQVDLQRIVNTPIAQQQVITQTVRQAITAVAGRHLVLVKPAVIQGATDITDAVLVAMTLPSSSDIKQHDNPEKPLKTLLLQDKQANTQPNHHPSSEVPEWLMP